MLDLFGVHLSTRRADKKKKENMKKKFKRKETRKKRTARLDWARGLGDFASQARMNNKCRSLVPPGIGQSRNVSAPCRFLVFCLVKYKKYSLKNILFSLIGRGFTQDESGFSYLASRLLAKSIRAAQNVVAS